MSRGIAADHCTLDERPVTTRAVLTSHALLTFGEGLENLPQATTARAPATHFYRGRQVV